MKIFACLGLAAVSYIVVATLLFGGPLKPLLFLTIWSGHLGVPYWRLMAIIGMGIAASVFFRPFSRLVQRPLRLPIFIAASMVLPVIMVGLYADWVRREAIHAFAAEHVTQHSFFRSLREAPKEFQFYLHAAALKDCVPYAWSYREMAFYILPPNVAVNVLPTRWIALCSIQRRP